MTMLKSGDLCDPMAVVGGREHGDPSQHGGKEKRKTKAPSEISLVRLCDFGCR